MLLLSIKHANNNSANYNNRYEIDEIRNTILSDLTKYKNKFGKIASDEAIKHGQWCNKLHCPKWIQKWKIKQKFKRREKNWLSQFLEQRQSMGFDIDNDVLLEQQLTIASQW